MIPMPYRLLAIAACAVGLYWLGHTSGAARVQERWDAAVAKQAAVDAQASAASAAVTTVEVVKYVDRVRLVRERADTVVKEIPSYVSPAADAACTVPAGFVRVHDAAARAEDAGPAGGDDDAATGIALSAVTETVAGNYGTCNLIREQLIGLQGWIEAQCTAQGGCDGR